MKPLSKVKKVILTIVCIIVVLRIGYIVFGSEIDKEYSTSIDYDLTDASEIPCNNVSQLFSTNRKRLNSLEFFFTNIADDKRGTITVQIMSGGDLIYQTNISLANINNGKWKKIFVNAEMFEDKKYTILLTSSKDCTQIPLVSVVKNKWAPEILKSYNDSQEIDGQIAINYGYLILPGILDKGCMVSLWIWFLTASILIILNFEKINNTVKKLISYIEKQIKPEILFAVCQVIFSIIILNCSDIEFQTPTKVIIYIISLVSVVNQGNKKNYIENYKKVTWKKILLLLLYAYAAFALVGQRIFIYPLTLKLTTAGIFVYVITTLWFIPVINSVIYYLEKVCNNIYDESRWKVWQFILISLFFLVISAFYNLFANNPGISTGDTFTCMIRQAQHLHGSGDWHPAFYCMVLRAIETVWNSTYAVIAVQYFFWSYVCLEMLLYLRKKGFRESILLCTSVFLGFNAGNYIHLNTIWKDIPYALSIFWTVIILAKLSIDYDDYKHKWYIYLELVIALIGTSLYRKNGIVTYIIIAVFLIIVLRKNVKVWVTVIVSAVLIFTIKGPVYTYFNIQPVEGGMYIGLSQDILGVYYSGGEVSENTLQMINVMTNYNNAEYEYTPTWSKQSYALDVDASIFIKNYIDTFLKNPVVMTRSIIDREDAVWNIYLGKDSILRCVNFTGTQDSVDGWNDYYPKRHYVSLYTQASAASAYTADTQWISAIEWRCGLFSLLGLIAFIYLLIDKKIKKNIILIAPIIGHILSLLLSTGWSEYRYFWPLNLMNPAFILFVILSRNSDNKEVLN